MKLNFLDKCAKIATLSTCVLNTNDNKPTSEAEFQLTDNFKVQTSYNFSYYDNIGDMTGPGQLEVHLFDINFFRDGQFLDRASFGTYADAPNGGPLCDENKELDIKLEWLKTAKPNIFERVRFMSNRMNLSLEEITAIERKSDELETIVDEMLQNKGRGR